MRTVTVVDLSTPVVDCVRTITGYCSGVPEHLTADRPDTSESEEMYLITIARAVEGGRQEPIPNAVIAEALAVTAASANEMVRKLETKDLVRYEPYRGVALTDQGRRVAIRVLRARRLWTTFLAEHLGLGPREADDQACHLEHVMDPDAVDRLAAFLGDPATDPLGRPIPRRDLPTHAPATGGLDMVPTGATTEVAAVRASGAAAAFLAGEGIVPGATLRVLAAGTSGVLVDTGTPVHLTADLAAQIDVRLPDQAERRSDPG